MTDLPLVLPAIADGEDKTSPFVNCIRKNYRHLRKWAKRTLTDSFRIYDRELHHYPLVIDFYAGRFCVHYFSPTRDQEEPAPQLVEDVEKGLFMLFQATPSDIFWRIRAKNKQTRQYEKVGESQEFFSVFEYGIKFRINLKDYLDTGLFLDHREARHLVAEACVGKRLLNLFAYTCSFSVQAAAEGAVFTKSVDMSNTYTAWGRENFILNGMSSEKNQIVRADCLKFLVEEVRVKEFYDVIVIDPPTISRSKKMDQLFDIQVDYIALITLSLQLLHPNGVLFFSTNSRRFVFDTTLFPKCEISDLSHKIVPPDFKSAKTQLWKLIKK
ncbi:MAG: class I SAM-dependent methyltransferase [Parachlamydiaceae bacterium]|nr:class I SAM-dependent methyltransferase [Parachlamydiaceae bacterium]